MLSPKFMVDLAVPQRKRSLMGTWLLSDSASALRDCAAQMAVPAPIYASPETALTFVRPQAHFQASLPGYGAQVAVVAETAAQQQPTSNVSYAHTTRIAAGNGGLLGPQPPRDPV
ncbi:MAG TPA: hypothetical protein VFQ44_24895 [Streptosporangiaceae bacterium]|nr:hypothetical protein [Streptosporangiaceae bacterium]